MDKQQLQKLRDLPIEGVAERLGLRVNRHKCLCPFHTDHTPSLSFCQRRNTYRCFVCGATGSTIDLVMNYLHLDFLPACRWLADEHNVIINLQPTPPPDATATPPTFDPTRYQRFFEHPHLSPAAQHFLYDERHLDPRVITWCRLTSWRDKAGTEWLQIPYYSVEGQLIGIQNRRIKKQDQAPSNSLPPPRFRFPYGSKCSIYNLPILNMLKQGEPLYITEGASDCWAMLSSGHKAIAIPSATLLNPNDIHILTNLTTTHSTTYHMYPDNDLPGQRLFQQLKQLLPELVHHHLPTGIKDFGEYHALIKGETTFLPSSRGQTP